MGRSFLAMKRTSTKPTQTKSVRYTVLAFAFALILSVALTFCSSVGFAQPVYSVNVVGYVTKIAPPGLSMFSNQLNADPNNRVQTLIASAPGSITVSKFNAPAGNFDLAIYDPDSGWNDPTSMVLNPGQGAFLDNATGANLSLVFVGEIQLSSVINIHPGLDVYSSPLPIEGDLNAIGFPTPPCSLSFFKFNGRAYDVYVFDQDAGGWSPTVPTVKIADAFFLDNPCFPIIWTRNFVIGP